MVIAVEYLCGIRSYNLLSHHYPRLMFGTNLEPPMRVPLGAAVLVAN